MFYDPISSEIIFSSLQGGAIAIKASLDNKTVFSGAVLIGPAILADPRTLSPFKVCILLHGMIRA